MNWRKGIRARFAIGRPATRSKALPAAGSGRAPKSRLAAPKPPSADTSRVTSAHVIGVGAGSTSLRLYRTQTVLPCPRKQLIASRRSRARSTAVVAVTGRDWSRNSAPPANAHSTSRRAPPADASTRTANAASCDS